MSLDKSFASLLRHSKLATYDRRINQVYSTPKYNKQRGDWGLKRNLPTVIRTPFVTIGQLDTVEHQTPWQSGESQVGFLRRWKENFSHVPSAVRRTRPHYDIIRQRKGDHLHYNIASMNRREFDHFLKNTMTQEIISALHQALQTKEITREEVYDYLNISFNPEPPSVVGPIYSTEPSLTGQDELTVEGRILNAEKGGYAVGIGGVVAHLPKRFTVGLQKPSDRLLVRKFYVRRAYIDEQGRPHVTVALQPTQFTDESILSPTSSVFSTVNSATSALPSTASTDNSKRTRRTQHWTTVTLDDLFGTKPPNNMDELQLYLLEQDATGRLGRRHLLSRSYKETEGSTNTTQLSSSSPSLLSSSLSSLSPSQASSPLPISGSDNDRVTKSKEDVMEDHAVLMNRIIALLKNGPTQKE